MDKNKFTSLVTSASCAGMQTACRKKLTDAAREANWYSDDIAERISNGTFDALRELINEAEALWTTSQATSACESK
jgi:hypothetical protein